jgi:hypothetical protein
MRGDIVSGYLMILAIATLGGWVIPQVNKDKYSRKIYIIIIFFLMFLFAAMRNISVGIDYISRCIYAKQIMNWNFSQLVSSLKSDNRELGYTLYLWIVTHLFRSPIIANILMDAFVLCTFAFLFHKYSKDIIITTLIYIAFVFPASLNITRQYVAVAFFLIALDLLVCKKPIKALIPLSIAVAFHTSALILFSIYVIYIIDFKFTRKRFFILITIACLGFVGFSYVVDWFIRLFPQYIWYTRGSWAVGSEEFSVLWLCIYIVLAVLIVFAIDRKPKKCKSKELIPNHNSVNDIDSMKEKENTIEYRIFGAVIFGYVIYSLLGILTSEIWFVSRMRAYFIYSFCMIIPEILDRIGVLDYKSKRFVRIVFIIGMNAWAILMFKQNGHGILPYTFLWE